MQALRVGFEIEQKANRGLERQAALAMLDRCKPGSRRITLGADKAYDVTGFTGLVVVEPQARSHRST